MLDISPTNLLMEIEASERLRDMHLEAMDDQVRRYHGPKWRAGSSESDDYPENHAYEYLSLMVPRIVLDNPRVRVSTRRPGSQGDVALAMKHALNRWVRDTSLVTTLIRVAVDTMFNHGVILTSQSPRPGKRKADPSYWPAAYRLPQKWFFRDYLGRHDTECRYMGHRWRRDKDDLIKRAERFPKEGWNLEALRELVTDNESPGDKTIGERTIQANPRGEVTAYELWVPEYEMPDSPGRDEGFHGTIFTIARQQPSRKSLEDYGNPNSNEAPTKAAFIREPRAYYGPRWGPYTTFGIFTVPDQAYPLAPLTAVQTQQDDLNQHVMAASHADAQYKRLVLVDNSDPRLLQRIKNSEDSYVIPVAGLEAGKVVQVELGGSTPQQWEMIAQKRDRLDRNSGIFDAQRGNVSGRGTATENAIADEASESRVGFIRHQFQDSTRRVLQSVAWYLYHDDRVEFPLGAEAAEEMQMQEPWFKGGDEAEGSGASFDDLELEIEPYSMERTSEGLQQRRTMEMVQLVSDIAPLMPQTPWVDWKQIFKHLGDSMNFPELDSIVDPIFAAELGGMQMPFTDEGQPRVGRDAGATGAYGQRPLPGKAKMNGQANASGGLNKPSSGKAKKVGAR